MAYFLKMHPAVEDEIANLPESLFSKVQAAIASLATEPRPVGSIKMAGYAKAHRIRVDQYRIVYTIHDKELVVVTIAVAPRGKIYPLAKRRTVIRSIQ